MNNDNVIKEISSYIIANYINNKKDLSNAENFAFALASSLLEQGYTKEYILSGGAGTLIEEAINREAEEKKASDEELLAMDLVNRRGMERDVHGYILANFIDGHNLIFSDTEKKDFVNKVTKYLLNYLSAEDILNGKADKDIEIFIDEALMRLSSIKGKDDTELFNEYLSVITSKVNPEWFKKNTASLILLASLSLGAVGLVSANYYTITNQDSMNIGRIISDGKTSDDIVKQNSDYDGVKKITTYDNRGIAEDILKITYNNPELFDKVMQVTYNNYDFEILPNAEKTFFYLQILSASNPSYKDISDRVSSYSNFLDYVASTNLVQDFNPKIESIISKYRVSHFEGLTEEEKDILTEYMTLYKESSSLTDAKNTHDLQVMAKGVER